MSDLPTIEKDRPLMVQAVDRFEFRPATPDDVEPVVELYRDFFNESMMPGYGMVFAPERIRKWVAGAVDRGDIPHILAIEKRSGKLTGSISYMLNHTFTTEPYAELNKFYVRPTWRRSAVGRVLLILCLEIARADGAVAFSAGVASGTAAAPSLANLLVKMGFEPIPGAAYLHRRL